MIRSKRQSVRMIVAALAAVGVAARGAGAPEHPRSPTSPGAGCPGPGDLAGRPSIEADGALRLPDGSAVVPAGVAWLRPRNEASGAGPDIAGFRALFADREIALAEAGAPDRWGRRQAHVWVPDADDEPVLLASLLLAAGLARVAPEAVSEDCAAALFSIEAKARAAGAGLWPRAGAGPWRPDDPAMAELIGRYVLIEGRVASIGQGRDRIYLNFGGFRDQAAVVTIRKRILNRQPDWGKRVAALAGRRVIVRGVLLEGRQVSVDVAVPAQIERLD